MILTFYIWVSNMVLLLKLFYGVFIVDWINLITKKNAADGLKHMRWQSASHSLLPVPEREVEVTDAIATNELPLSAIKFSSFPFLSSETAVGHREQLTSTPTTYNLDAYDLLLHNTRPKISPIATNENPLSYMPLQLPGNPYPSYIRSLSFDDLTSSNYDGSVLAAGSSLCSPSVPTYITSPFELGSFNMLQFDRQFRFGRIYTSSSCEGALHQKCVTAANAAAAFKTASGAAGGSPQPPRRGSASYATFYSYPGLLNHANPLTPPPSFHTTTSSSSSCDMLFERSGSLNEITIALVNESDDPLPTPRICITEPVSSFDEQDDDNDDDNDAYVDVENFDEDTLTSPTSDTVVTEMNQESVESLLSNSNKVDDDKDQPTSVDGDIISQSQSQTPPAQTIAFTDDCSNNNNKSSSNNNVNNNNNNLKSNICNDKKQIIVKNDLALTNVAVCCPTKPLPKIMNKNPDSPQTGNNVRRQRHSISGQMSVFKTLGFGRKLATSTNSLFSTAVISGSNSAPNLRDMLPNTTAASGNVLCKFLPLFSFFTIFFQLFPVFIFIYFLCVVFLKLFLKFVFLFFHFNF